MDSFVDSLTIEQIKQAIILLHENNPDTVNNVMRQITSGNTIFPEPVSPFASATTVTNDVPPTGDSESLVNVLDDETFEGVVHDTDVSAALSAAPTAMPPTTPVITWENRFQELALYKAQNGTCDVSKNDNDALHSWILSQRDQYRQLQQHDQYQVTATNNSDMVMQLSDDRIAKLCSIGFSFDTTSASATTRSGRNNNDTNNQQEQNEQLQKTTGDTNLSSTTTTGNRSKKSGGTVPKVPWLKRFEALKEYKEKEGHCRVPVRKGSNYTALGKWVEHQRQNYRLRKEGKPSAMTIERINLLESVGFEWTIMQKNKAQRQIPPSATASLKQNQHLEVAGEGTSLVLSNVTESTSNDDNDKKRAAVEGSDNGTFPSTRKRQRDSASVGVGDSASPSTVYTIGHGGANTSDTTCDIINATDNEVSSTKRSKQHKKWFDRYEELKAFARQNGHCRVAAGKGKKNNYSQLGKWVEHQRTQYRLLNANKKSSMTLARSQLLQEIGFEFVVDKRKLLNSHQQQEDTTDAGLESTMTSNISIDTDAIQPEDAVVEEEGTEGNNEQEEEQPTISI